SPPAVGPCPDHAATRPHTQPPTQTSITVMWQTAVAGTSVDEYGPTPAALKTAEAEKDATIHEVKIDGLEPETKYVYRVSTTAADGKTGTSPLYQVMTAVQEGA